MYADQQGQFILIFWRQLQAKHLLMTQISQASTRGTFRAAGLPAQYNTVSRCTAASITAGFAGCQGWEGKAYQEHLFEPVNSSWLAGLSDASSAATAAFTAHLMLLTSQATMSGPGAAQRALHANTQAGNSSPCSTRSPALPQVHAGQPAGVKLCKCCCSCEHSYPRCQCSADHSCCLSSMGQWQADSRLIIPTSCPVFASHAGESHAVAGVRWLTGKAL